MAQTHNLHIFGVIPFVEFYDTYLLHHINCMTCNKQSHCTPTLFEALDKQLNQKKVSFSSHFSSFLTVV